MTAPHKVHKYKKARLGKKIIYRCVIPGCAHYVFRELVLNKISLCWKCNEPFVMPRAASLLKTNPVCDSCSDLRKKKKPEQAVEIPADIMDRILSNF